MICEKDNIKAEVSSSLGTVTAVTTKGGNASSWKIEARGPEFGDDGKVTKNPRVVILQTVPGYSNDAVLTVSFIDNTGASFSASKALTAEKTSADLVVYGKVFTSDNYELAEAFAVKDGRYIYVGDRESASVFVEEGRTQVIDYGGKGLVMPSCGDGVLTVDSPYHRIDTSDCVQLPPNAVVADNADNCNWADNFVDGNSLIF